MLRLPPFYAFYFSFSYFLLRERDNNFGAREECALHFLFAAKLVDIFPVDEFHINLRNLPSRVAVAAACVGRKSLRASLIPQKGEGEGVRKAVKMRGNLISDH